jgi:hypothetical protein
MEECNASSGKRNSLSGSKASAVHGTHLSKRSEPCSMVRKTSSPTVKYAQFCSLLQEAADLLPNVKQQVGLSILLLFTTDWSN